MGEKHIFDCDTKALAYMALGDSAIRILAIHHLIELNNLDALVKPHHNPEVRQLWRDVLKERLIEGDIPPEYKDAVMHAPSSEDWWEGQSAYTTFETVIVENGFPNTKNLLITPPVVYPCDPRSQTAMIYPDEITDGNRIYNSRQWGDIYDELRAFGYKINYLGNRRSEQLKGFYKRAVFDREFPPTVDGLKQCIRTSSLSIGANTGPTWACLFSDIQQICLCANKSPHAYWNFDRCQKVLSKDLHVLPTLEALIEPLTSTKRMSLPIRQQLESAGVPFLVRVSNYHHNHPFPEKHLSDGEVINQQDKWALDQGEGAWAEFIFDKPTYISEMKIFHAGILEGQDYNTKDYNILFNDELLEIRDNKESITIHNINAVVERVKLKILEPNSSDKAVRIYEIKFFS